MVFFAIAGKAEETKEPQRVLVLNSYHAGYSWSDGELQGLQRVLLKEFPGLIPSVEFLDMKRDFSAQYHKEQLAFIQHKYRGVRFELVVTLDDAALRFALDHRAALGADVPIVFGGVNNYSPEKFAGVRNLTGVAEAFDFAANLELALQLRPQLKTVHLLLDSAESSVDTLAAFEKVAVRFRDRLRFEKIADWTADELLVRLAALPPQDVVLYLGGARDINGRIVSEDEGYISMINERSAAPIFMVNQPVLPLAFGPGWEKAVWYGAGGYMISSDLHGEAIGGLAARILRGEDAGSIPVLTMSPTRLAFDYRQVVRHKLELSRMPPGTEFFNRTESFFELYRWRIFGALAVILVLAGAVVFLLLNILLRKRAEQELVLLRTAVDQAKDFIALIGPVGDVLYANSSLARVLRGEGVRLARCDELWRGADGSATSFATISALAREEGRWQRRVPLTRDDGQPALLQLIVTPIRTVSEGAAVFLLIGQDVTQEARLEEQVRVSQKMDAIGTLASGVAHDFNNILTAIVVNSEMAQSEIPADHPSAEMLSEIRKATERASHLVRQILTFSRHAEPRREVASVTPVVNDTLKFLRATVPAAVEIKHTVNATPLIEVDPTQLYQVILNLCTNAVHAIGARPGVLEVTEDAVDVRGDLIATHPDLKPGPHLRLSVKDSGDGMPPDVVHRIFEPFYTTKKPGEGTGLGLSVVHGILKQHRAAITVDSSPGCGTVFHLYFPVAAGGFVDATSEGEPARAGSRGAGQHIVLVDDEPAITQIAGRALQNAGYQVVSFNLPDDALHYLRGAKADLLITDFSMPGIGALELVKQVRTVSPDLPVVMISGYISDPDRAQAVAAGVGEIVDKPLSVQALLAAVERGCRS